MANPAGFTYQTRKNGEVAISRDGRQVSILRGQAAQKFLKRLETMDSQELMARTTGNYKRGNERGSA